MPRSVVPAFQRGEDVGLIAAAHHAFETLVELVRVVTADTLNPHLASVFTDLFRDTVELGLLATLRAGLYPVHILWEIESAFCHNSKRHNQAWELTADRAFLGFGVTFRR